MVLLEQRTDIARANQMEPHKLLMKRILNCTFGLVIASLSTLIFTGCDAPTKDSTIKLRLLPKHDAEIVGVVDGDTTVALIDGEEIEVDLFGVEMLQIDESPSSAAALYLSANVLGEKMRLMFDPDADPARSSARFFDSDNNELQIRMLTIGLVGPAKHEFRQKAQYEKHQKIAQENRLGFWSNQSLAAAFVLGIDPLFSEETADGPPGRWREARTTQRNTTRDISESLHSIGYLGGHDLASEDGGVSNYNPEAAHNGLNLIVSGHGHEASLVDMDGAVVHRWRYTWERVSPDWKSSAGHMNLGHEYWRRAMVFPNGDLIAIYENLGMVRIDSDSNLLWSYLDSCHHDIEIGPDGHIYVLTRRLRSIPPIEDQGKVVNDCITILNTDGELVRTINIVDCFLNSDFAQELDRIRPTFDPLHVNSVRLLSGKGGFFREGCVLISIREISLLAVIDLDQERVTWVRSGPWRRQHDPRLLANGRILLFDNLGGVAKSRVMELDPKSGAISWIFEPEDAGSFFTEDCGASHRLENGNTLAIESNRGRALEIDKAGTVVWEYLNPQRSGSDDEFVATLLDVIRLPIDFANGWANNGTIENGNDKVHDETT